MALEDGTAVQSGLHDLRFLPSRSIRPYRAETTVKPGQMAGIRSELSPPGTGLTTLGNKR
jgi:hypothetical protein